MTEQSPQGKIYEIKRCFQDQFREPEGAPSSWKIMKLMFPRKPGAAPKKGIRSYRAIALTSVMSKWFAACVILRLERERVCRMEALARGWYLMVIAVNIFMY